ncbi:MAG: hypothetical protein H7A52_14955 [Akkermansiaceae bacterium]|nr:hypothetical protein [Akkermansiaceae bacterium]
MRGGNLAFLLITDFIGMENATIEHMEESERTSQGKGDNEAGSKRYGHYGFLA